jgi:hypothetical protein
MTVKLPISRNTDSDLLYLRNLYTLKAIIPMIAPTIMTPVATLKYRVFKQKINICLDNILSVLLRLWCLITPFGIFKLFLINTCNNYLNRC